MWSLKLFIALFLVSMTGHAADCGPVTYSAARLPKGGQLWFLGSRYVYEFNGGLSTSIATINPGYRFAQAGERLITAWSASPTRTLLITRQKRGFAAYLWESSGPTPTMTALVARSLNAIEGQKTIASPLVDAHVDATQTYLLTNFHVTTLSTPALLAGSFTATTEKIPQCDSVSESCWRGVSLLPMTDGLGVARMRRLTGNTMNLDLVRPYGASPVDWSIRGGLSLSKATYVNALKSHSAQTQDSITPLAISTNKSTHILLARQPAQTLAGLSDYPVAAALLPSTNFSAANGALSLSEQGTFFFKEGVMTCRAFETASSLVVKQNTNTTEIAGVNASGNLMTVEVGN